MDTSDWNGTVRSLIDRIISLSSSGIEVSGVDVDRRSTPDEAWINVTVRVPDAMFAPEHDEAFYDFKREVRRVVDDLVGDQSDFRVLYVSQEASREQAGNAA